MAKLFFRLRRVFFLIALLSIVGCFPNEPDVIKPEISFEYPPHKSVIGESVLLQAEARDDESVARVEFFVNGSTDSTLTDREPPYEARWVVPDTFQIGREVTFFAKVIDNQELEMLSNIIEVNYLWRTLIDDKDEPFSRNFRSISVRNTGELLEFNFRMHNNVSSPYDSEEGMATAIFLDVDMDSSSGVRFDTAGTSQDSLSQDDEPITLGKALTDHLDSGIGVDAALITGNKGDSLLVWSREAGKWQGESLLDYTTLKDDTSQYSVGINRSHLQGSTQLKIMAVNLAFRPDTVFVDWIPDQGYSSYTIDDAYFLGNDE